MIYLWQMVLEARLGIDTAKSLDSTARLSLQRLVDGLIWVPFPELTASLVHSNVIAAGADLCFIPDMEEVMQVSPALIRAVFSPDEVAYSMIQARPVASFAARYAAKEAAYKACGYPLRDVVVVHGANNHPSIRLKSEAMERALRLGIKDHLLGLSHDGDYALAFFIAVC